MDSSPEPAAAAAFELPLVSELLERALVLSLPMAVPFRGISRRETLLIEGPAGWGEFAPFPDYNDRRAGLWLQAALEASRWGYPRSLRSRIPINATVPAVGADRVPRVLERFGPVDTVKVKVAAPGQDIQEDIARVAATRAFHPHARIRIDANGAWTHTQALQALSCLATYDLEYAEQPVADIEGLLRLREAITAAQLPVKLAADESVRLPEDPLAVARAGAADILVLKTAPLGGVRAALDVADRAGLPVVVSSALESSVGISMGVALAAALPELRYACGLGTAQLLAADCTESPASPAGGFLPVHAVEPSKELLQEYAAPAERQRWWRERLGCAWLSLEQQWAAAR